MAKEHCKLQLHHSVAEETHDGFSLLPARCFFWLLGQDACGLRALTARILGKRGVDRGRDLVLICRLLVVLFAWDRWPKGDDFAGVCVDQDAVLVGMGLLVAAGVVLWPRRLRRALAAAFGPINGQRWRTFPGQRRDRDTARLTCRRHRQRRERLWQHRQHMMKPVVGLRLTHAAWPPMQRVQGGSLLRDQNKQELVGCARQLPFDASASTSLAGLPIQRALRRIFFVVGGLERGQ